MSVLDQLSCHQGTKSEIPNQELAAALAKDRNIEGIREIADNLWHKDKKVGNCCIKVLYEIGEKDPELIEPYAQQFFNCLSDKNNRLVWGGMTALSTLAFQIPQQIVDRLAEIEKAIRKGSVITVDRGVLTLARAASVSGRYQKMLMPKLLDLLKTCRPNSVAQYAESISIAVDEKNTEKFCRIVEERKPDVSKAAGKRLEKLLKTYQS